MQNPIMLMNVQNSFQTKEVFALVINTKLYLKSVKLYDTHINNKLAELSRLNDMLTNITSTLKDTVVSGSGSNDTMGDAITRLFELRVEINQAIDEFVDRKQDVMNVINQLEDADQLAVIHKRYVQYKNFDRIAEEMECTKRWACKIHGEALVSVEKIIKKSLVRSL